VDDDDVRIRELEVRILARDGRIVPLDDLAEEYPGDGRAVDL